MRCACGQPGSIETSRRAFPYCAACFERHLVKSVRAEIGDGPLRLKPTADAWETAARSLATLARREVVLDEHGVQGGCLELAAAAAMDSLFAAEGQPRTEYFPASLALEELLIQFPTLPALQTKTVEELRELEAHYPGTMRAIIHSARDREEAQRHA